MTTRSRQSGTAPMMSRSRGSTRLPEHHKPQFAMNTQAQRSIDNLYARHDFKKLQEIYLSAVHILSESVADINERVVERRQRLEKLSEKKRKEHNRDGNDEEPEPDVEDAETKLKELHDKVESMTRRLDENLRKTIDGQESIARTRTLLDGTAHEARTHATTQASLPVRATQQQRPRLPRDSDDEDEGEEDDEPESEYPEIDPTAPEENTQVVIGPVDHFQRQVEDAKLLYQSRELAARYAGNTSYRQFRKLLHNAQFPDGDVPEPQPEDWFDETGRARPGVTLRQAGEDDEEEDLQVQRATTSTKCPITLQEFKEPLTSTKCNHTFEASAIHQMIQASTRRVDQIVPARGQPYGGKPAVRCPVQSCEQLLSIDDLLHDPIVIRRIKNLQRALELEAQDALNNSHIDAGPELIDDDDEDEDAMDVDDIEAEDVVPASARVKSEKLSARR